MYISALFTIAWAWKQPKHPLIYEWIRKLWYIYTMGILLNKQTNKTKQNKKITSHLGQFLMRWTKLEPIIQSEVSQKEKHRYSILTHIYGI